jgi:glycosyltransferase involved in cell wall biosynthesis
MQRPDSDHMLFNSVPEVSFVVIAYNEAPSIEHCLESILNQDDVGPIEILVVDDGSTDATARLVEHIAAQEPSVCLLRSDRNRGRGHARKMGVDAAKGDLIAMVDADIILPCYWLSKARSALSGYAAVGGIAVPDGDVAYLHRRFGLTAKVRPATLSITGNNGLYRRDVFNFATFDPGLSEGEDIAMVKSMEAAGLRIRCIPDLTVEHRESKQFVRSLRWLYQSGIGATRQYRRYRQLRVADVTFGAYWGVAIFSTVIGRRLGRRGAAFALPIITCVGIAGAHTATRFDLRKAGPVRASAAIATDSAFIAAYLAGRTIGLTRTSGRRQ